ncbi:MAG TPA: hypothetical protein VN962_26965 [Polyangia bacterium]|nr:hypothetical protein [Polyangia bacterium]
MTIPMARSVRPSDAAEDAPLIAAAAAGDRRAFADLYRRHLDSVYARLTRVVGPPAVKQRVLEARRELARSLDREPKEST